MKLRFRGMSLVEIMISAGLLAGIFYAGTLMIQTSEQGNRKIHLGIERNSAFNLIGKTFKKDGVCNSLLHGHTLGDDIATNLQAILPTKIRNNINISAAILRDHPTLPAPANGIGPLLIDVTAQFFALGGGNDTSSYRFFLEAQFDGSRKVVFCATSEVTTLSTTCDLLGGTLRVRDVDGDQLALEVACQLPDCPVPGVLSQLYLSSSNPTILAYPSPLVIPYREQDAISRYCMVQDLSIFLAQIAPNPGRYVLQAGSDTISGTLEGTAGATFQTNANLVAQRWGIAGSYRTNLQPSPCPNGRYVTGVNVDGTIVCAPSPLGGCNPVCPIASELCWGFVYDGVDGCGGVCNVTGTRPPACVSGGTDPNVCLNQPSVKGNGCGGTCNLIGSKTDGVCAPTPTPTSVASSTPTPGATPTTAAGGSCYLVSSSFHGVTTSPPTLTYNSAETCNPSACVCWCGYGGPVTTCRDTNSYIVFRVRCPGITNIRGFYFQTHVPDHYHGDCGSYSSADCSNVYAGISVYMKDAPAMVQCTGDTCDFKIMTGQGYSRTSVGSPCNLNTINFPVTHVAFLIRAVYFGPNPNFNFDRVETDWSPQMIIRVKN